MSSTYLTSHEMAMIDRLLAEVSPSGTDRTSTIVTLQARLLVAAFRRGVTGERALRRLLSAHILFEIIAASRRRWEDEAFASPHRQKDIPASPGEEFDCATSINSMATAPHGDGVLIARGTSEELLQSRRVSEDEYLEVIGRWVQENTKESFDMVN